MTSIARELSQEVGITRACQALDIPRSRLYPRRSPAPVAHRACKQALSTEERAKVRAVLNSERFMDRAPRQVYATLLDEGIYLCHWRSMYRILAAHGEVRERRKQRQCPVYRKPELLAERSNQVWSWDITKLRGPAKWTHFALYTVLDIFSRYVVGWMIAERESAELAKQLIATAAANQRIQPDQLTLHADNGNPMKSKTLALLLSDLGVNKSHSRPYVSDDNPFSEAQFKTMKYHPDYPDRFGCIQDARAWARPFFQWYNYQHYHIGLNLLTPASVHYGQADHIRQQRQAVLAAAYVQHPHRFVRGKPIVKGAPDAVWINPPIVPNLP
ncbi:IS3 family transposase [Candidatus Uhrbacteria bacterium]|nr:IS3 family transposase [Candidatus Uhrbacteria bacterium]